MPSQDRVRATPKRGKKPARLREEPVSYVVRILGWDRWWSFGINHEHKSGPYTADGTLVLNGEVFRPEGFRYPRAAITLGRHEGFDEDGPHPTILGTLSGAGDLLQIYVPVPAESMAELTALAASDRLRIAHLIGTTLRYGRGSVQSIELHTEFDPEEW